MEHHRVDWGCDHMVVPRLAGPFMAMAVLAAACGSDDPVADPGSLDPTSVTVESGFTGELVGAGAARPLILTDPADTPELDQSIASVDLSTIVFDTFDGGLIPLDQADQPTVDTLRDLISPIDAPEYESVASAAEWLTPDDVVVAYVDDNSASWAYPVRLLNFHEIVNDELAGRPVLISYCPLCESGVVYDRRIDGETLSFSNTSALHQADLVMVDRETGSYWWQVAGRSIVGPLTDVELTVLPSSVERWSDWSASNPLGSVLSRLPGEERLPNPFLGLAQRIDNGLRPLQVDSDVLNDRRLSPGSTVVVAEFDGSVVAWPISPARTSVSKVGDRSLVIRSDGTGASITDERSGERIPTRTSLWFAIVASFPGVTIGSESAA